MDHVDNLQRKITSIEIGRQLKQSAGSVEANHREVNELLNKKDFLMRIKIFRKGATYIKRRL